MSQTPDEWTGSAREPLELTGEFLYFDEDGDPVYGPLTVSQVGTGWNPDDHVPVAALLTVDMPTRTTADLTILEGNKGARVRTLEYEVWRATDAGAASLVHTIDLEAGDPLTWTDTGLPTNTPEYTFTYTVYGVNADGTGAASNAFQVQWNGTPTPVQPTAPTSLVASSLQPTSVQLTWTETPDPTVTKHGLFQGSTLLVDNLPSNALAHLWTGRTPSTAYNNINVRRYNAVGWSPASNLISFTTPATSGGGILFPDHQPGKIYLGWSTNQGDTYASNELDTYSPGGGDFASKLGVRRFYNKSQSIGDYADAQNRMWWISAKGTDWGGSGGVAGWSQVASGARDTSMINWFESIIARDKRTIFSFHHEPIGDSTTTSDATIYVNACRRIRSVIDSAYPGHKILFCFNYEENRLRNLNVNGQPVNWALWIPSDWQDIWHFPSFDFYQYGANSSTSPTAGVMMSHRWWRVDGLFTGDFVPNGTTAMPWMNLTPGVDFTYGIGETSPRPGAFYNWENNLSTASERSNVTGAKFGRDLWDYVFSNIDKFWCVSTFNSIGANYIYNEERLVPRNGNQSGDQTHPSWVTQTGDTERIIDIYREKLNSGLTCKLP